MNCVLLLGRQNTIEIYQQYEESENYQEKYEELARKRQTRKVRRNRKHKKKIMNQRAKTVQCFIFFSKTFYSNSSILFNSL